MKEKNQAFLILVVLIGFNVLAWIGVYNLSYSQFLEVNFFDVGQGDAIFVQTPDRYQILIDGGPDSTLLEKLAQEMPFYDRTIDLIILTHPEHDHINGLLEVLKRYKVENILWTGIIRDTSEYKEWQKLIQEEKKEGAKIYIARAGQSITAGNVLMATLNPFESLEGEEVKNTNNTSVIIRLVFNQSSFLFTGDAYKSVERKLIKVDIEIDSDVLKVGHHGSKTSTAKEFVEAVSPGVVVISAGKDNQYGHPHLETLQNLEGIKILRTDLDGDIKIISDGINYQIK